MRVVFMGTPDFAVATLQAIVENGHEVVGVYTQPDKPKGRGKELTMTPVKAKALELGVPIFQPVKVKDSESISELRAIAPDVMVVVAFGQLLSKEILDMPKYGCVNVHASLLPAYRGAAPIENVIIDGCKKTGVTTMMMDVGLDTGDMIEQVEVLINDNETSESLHNKLSHVGANLLVKTLQDIEAGTMTRTKQDDEKSNYVGMLHKSLGLIDFNKNAVVIERLIRGLNPWPSAYTHMDGKTLKIWSANVVLDEFNGDNGSVVMVTKSSFIVKCGEAALEITEVQMEGKKRMNVEAFLRGYKVQIGTQLS